MALQAKHMPEYHNSGKNWLWRHAFFHATSRFYQIRKQLNGQRLLPPLECTICTTPVHVYIRYPTTSSGVSLVVEFCNIPSHVTVGVGFRQKSYLEAEMHILYRPQMHVHVLLSWNEYIIQPSNARACIITRILNLTDYFMCTTLLDTWRREKSITTASSP